MSTDSLPLKDHNLLIIDDEVEVTKALTRQFRKKYNVFSASDVEDAFEIMENESIQVVLSDQRMPHMTGVDFFTKIKDKYPDAPKVILTGYSDIEAVIGAINQGQIFRYVTKPWNPEELDSVISEAFEKYELITQNRKLTQNLREANITLEEKVKVRTSELKKLNTNLTEVNREKNIYIGIIDAIFNSVPGLIYLYDEDGKLVRWNKKHELFTGYSSEELSQMHLLDFYKGDAEIQKIITEAVKTTFLNGFGETEAALSKKDGSVIPMYFTASKLTIDGKNFFTGIGIDITERKLAEAEIKNLNQELEQKVIDRTEQLKIAYKELEAFSYSISHHLRTPLRAIDGFANILLDEYALSLDVEGKRLFQVIIDNANKMGQLIDELLSFSSLNRMEIKYSPIDMHNLAYSAYDELTGKEEKENIKFRLQNIPPATGDASLINVVWINLIGNAIKFTSGKTDRIIEIGSKTEDDSIIYYVNDNGAGYNMEYSNKLFAVFQHLHSPKHFEGNGVGLAIVQRIIEQHKGRVWAEGKVGEGATFYFTLADRKDNKNQLQKNI